MAGHGADGLDPLLKTKGHLGRHVDGLVAAEALVECPDQHLRQPARARPDLEQVDRTLAGVQLGDQAAVDIGQALLLAPFITG